MSRALAAAAREPLDAYQTPAPLAREIVAVLAARLHVRFPEVIEPSAGLGAFVRAARDEWPAAHITANDVDPAAAAACRAAGADVTFAQDWPTLASRLAAGQDESRPPRRLIVGNPPFREAEEHVAAGMRLLLPGEHLAFLLRINFLGAARRLGFWREHRPAWVAPIVPRPSFTGGGTDGTEYGLFVWRKAGRGGARLARPVVWTPERARRVLHVAGEGPPLEPVADRRGQGASGAATSSPAGAASSRRARAGARTIAR